jgi:hypothetical protein
MAAAPVVGRRREPGAGVDDLDPHRGPGHDHEQVHAARAGVPDGVRDQLGHEQAQALENGRVELGLQPTERAASRSGGAGAPIEAQLYGVF